MKQVCILILGMHRSGTSALSGVLNTLDVYLGSSLIGAMEQNAKGFYENVFLNRVNDRLLGEIGSGWDDVFFDERKLEKIECLSELKDVLVQEFRFSKLFAIKDPRLAYLFPLYAKVLSDLDVEIKIVIPIRNPLEVAESLRARDGFSSEKGLLLWAYNFLLSEKHSRIFPRVFTQFDDLLKFPDKTISLIDHKLGLDLSSKLESKRELLDGFLTPSLKHQNISIDNFSNGVPKIVRDIILRAPLLNENNLSEEFDSLRKELFCNQALFYNSDIVSDLNELDAARQSASVKDQALDQAMQEMNAKDQALDRAMQEMSVKDQALDRAMQEMSVKDQALDRAMQEMSVKDQALDRAMQEMSVKDQVLDRAMQEISVKGQALDHAMQEMNEKDQSSDLARKEMNEKYQASLQLKLELDAKCQALEQANQALDEERRHLQEQLLTLNNNYLKVTSSKSWLLTKPLRFLRRSTLTKPNIFIRSVVSSGARSLWQKLPLAMSTKQKFKGAVFTALPTFLGWSQAYRSWLSTKAPIHYNLPRSYNVLPAQSQLQATSGEYVPLLQAAPLKDKPVRLICFYLPQFHPIAENNAWWGEGFTEWTNVQPAQPQFAGHYQPHVPGELGYYSLLDPTVQRRQIELAKLYGVEGFCFYFYWFGGKRLLEKPLENYLSDSSLDLPFCLCWANENWSRRWDGLDSEILIAQQHSPEDDLAFISHIAQYMRDSRYIRIDGKPLLLVYRPSLLPSAKETSERWRTWCRINGIGEIYLAYTQSFETVDPAKYGFDAAIEFPPNNSAPTNITEQVEPLKKDFSCNVYDWRIFVERSNNYKTPGYPLFRGVCPAWDNTARRKNNSSILLNSSPLGYQQWLYNAIDDTCKRFTKPDERLVFINAWNEWAEGAHLEPDQRYGYSYLEATRMALVRKKLTTALRSPRQGRSLAIVVHAFYEDVFDQILAYLEKIRSIPFKLYVTTPHSLQMSIRHKLSQQQHDFTLLPVINRGRDVLPFVQVLPDVIKGEHDFLVKIHTKKSVHRSDGEAWRQELFEQLITEEAITSSLETLERNPELGILGPTGHIVPMSYYWGSNASRTEKLAARLGVESSVLQDLNFVAGTMFIARVDALSPILNLAISENDFEVEAGQVDGTLAHAIERLFAASAYAINQKTTCKKNKSIKSYAYAEKK